MKYKITVETGKLHGAGTNACVSIKLTGMIEFPLLRRANYCGLAVRGQREPITNHA